MWDRASPTATAVAEEIAKDKAMTEEVCADVEAVTLVPREQVQQGTSEQSEDTPQAPAETVEPGSLVQRERVQQRTVEQIEDGATVSRRDCRCGDAGPACERVQLRSAGQIVELRLNRQKSSRR